MKLLPFKAGVGMLLEHFADAGGTSLYCRHPQSFTTWCIFFHTFNKITVIFGEPILPDQLAKEATGHSKAEHIANSLHDRVSINYIVINKLYLGLRLDTIQ